ncbi:hypothetical protein [Thiorhodovibrio winogradskyi]|uniref:hypothetical protein n=1 Tax=Thiorhodovibrio winogradskyi TaxID=77007 RepID=UPI002E2D96CD|nr:hypothetical protein [Thiorhodovibrio winogradskyi]
MPVRIDEFLYEDASEDAEGFGAAAQKQIDRVIGLHGQPRLGVWVSAIMRPV